MHREIRFIYIMLFEKRKKPKSGQALYRYGFVLSGGAARCFVHLGVLKAFFEAGIRPDILSGTSAGAIAGAFIADGYEPEEILAFFHKMHYRDLADLALPQIGLSKMTKVKALLEKHLKARTFEELKIPLWVTASDFDRGVPVHFSTGPLIPPLLASSSVPIVFVPMAIDGTTYVDGGLFRNMPAGSIRNRCVKLVGVDVNPLSQESYGKNMRSMVERTLSLVIRSTIAEDVKMCDLVICPDDMTQYALTDVHLSEEIFKIGYDEAKRVLTDKIKKDLLR